MPHTSERNTFSVFGGGGGGSFESVGVGEKAAAAVVAVEEAAAGGRGGERTDGRTDALGVRSNCRRRRRMDAIKISPWHSDRRRADYKLRGGERGK